MLIYISHLGGGEGVGRGGGGEEVPGARHSRRPSIASPRRSGFPWSRHTVPVTGSRVTG